MKKSKNEDNGKSSKIILNILISMFIIIIVFIFCSFTQMYILSKNKKDIVRLNNEIKEIREIDEEIKEINNNLVKKNDENSLLREEINKIYIQIKDINFKINKLEGILEK